MVALRLAVTAVQPGRERGPQAALLEGGCASGLVLVPLHVQGQVVRAGEAAAAGQALEGLGSGVLAVVSGELIRAGKAPVAAIPAAPVGLLTWDERKQEPVTHKEGLTAAHPASPGGGLGGCCVH